MQSDFSSAALADSDKEFDSSHVSMDLAHGHTFQEPIETPPEPPKEEPMPAAATPPATPPPSSPTPAMAAPAAAAPPPIEGGSGSHKWWLIGGIAGAVLLLIPLIFFVFFYDDGSQEREDDDTTQVVEEEEPAPDPEPTPEPDPEPTPEPEPEPPVVTVDPLKTEESQPTVTGTVDDPSADVEVSVGERTYTASVDPSGNWEAVVSAELEPGTYDIVATANNGQEATDQTNNELEITKPAEPVDEPAPTEKEEEK